MPVTWKNMAPTDASGLLNVAARSAEKLGDSIGGLGDVFSQYTDTRSSQEADQLTAAMASISPRDPSNADDVQQAREDRAAILKSTEQAVVSGESWADLSAVIDAYKTANAPAEQTWQQKDAHEIRKAYITANKKPNKNSGYSGADFGNTLFKNNNKDEDVNYGMPVLRFFGLSDAPKDEVTARLAEHYRLKGYSPDEIERFNKIMTKDFHFDKNWVDEFKSLKFDEDVENLGAAQLDAIAEMGGFQTDAFIKANKDKNKTK